MQYVPPICQRSIWTDTINLLFAKPGLPVCKKCGGQNAFAKQLNTQLCKTVAPRQDEAKRAPRHAAVAAKPPQGRRLGSKLRLLLQTFLVAWRRIYNLHIWELLWALRIGAPRFDVWLWKTFLVIGMWWAKVDLKIIDISSQRVRTHNLWVNVNKDIWCRWYILWKLGCFLWSGLPIREFKCSPVGKCLGRWFILVSRAIMAFWAMTLNCPASAQMRPFSSFCSHLLFFRRKHFMITMNIGWWWCIWKSSS